MGKQKSDQQLEELYFRRIINFVSGKEDQNSKSIDVVKKSTSTLKGMTITTLSN